MFLFCLFNQINSNEFNHFVIICTQDSAFSDDVSSESCEPVSDSDTNAPIVLSSDSSESENCNRPAKKRRTNHAAKQNTTENEDLILEKALAIMEKKDDELDIFGQFIASEMRQLTNPSTRLVLKREIMKVVHQYAYSSVIETTNTHHTYSQQNFNNYPNQPYVYSAPDPTVPNHIPQYNNFSTNNIGTHMSGVNSTLDNNNYAYTQL